MAVFFFCILIIFIDYQFYVQFTTLTYYPTTLTYTHLHTNTHTLLRHHLFYI